MSEQFKPPDPAFLLGTSPELSVLEPRFQALRDRLIGRRIEAVYLMKGSQAGLLLDDTTLVVLPPASARRLAETGAGRRAG